MTIVPTQIESILRLYHKMASEKKIEDSPGVEIREREDVVTISPEAKRRQIQEQTRQQVIKKLKENLLSETR